MIKHLLSLILLLQLFTCLGQTNKPDTSVNKWTFGAIIYNKPAGISNYFGGLILKRKLPYFDIRSGIEYARNLNKTQKAGCCDFPSTEGYANEKLIRVGVEKGYILARYFRPYAAFDLTAIKKYSDIIYTGGFSGNMNDRWVKNATGFGIMPTLGFELFTTKNISAAIESRMQIIRSRVNYQIDNLHDPAGPVSKSDKISDKMFEPISAVTVQVSF